LGWLGRFSDEEVARRVGCPVKAVIRKRIKLHVRKRRDLLEVKPWTPAEDELVGTMADKQLAARLGRSVGSVGHRRRKLLRPQISPGVKRWSEADLALLGQLSDAEVVARTGHPLNSVKQKRCDLGRPPVNPKRRAWQPHEDVLLGTNTDKAIAARLGRDKTTVACRRLKLGIAPYFAKQLALPGALAS
jgi:hypothetical protein